MSPEIKVAFSREVLKGACVVGKEEEQPQRYTPVAISDCLGTDFVIDGIVRKMLKDGENPMIIFNNEEEMEENLERIQNAFGDLLGNEDEE